MASKDLTDLKNTYMFTSKDHNGRGNFWGKYASEHKYKNNNSNIEDPIFTGFTFSIDYETSPLFKVVTKNFPDFGSAKDIEETINKIVYPKFEADPSKYEINTLLTKSGAGYGKQTTITVDGVPYGAYEYIYMLDKLFDKVAEANAAGETYLGNASDTNVEKSNSEKKKELEEQNEEYEKYLSQYDEDIIEKIRKDESEKAAEIINIQSDITKLDNNIKAINEDIKKKEENIKKYDKAIFNKKVQEKIMSDSDIKEMIGEYKKFKQYQKQTDYDGIKTRIEELEQKISNSNSDTSIKYYDGNVEHVMSLVKEDDDYKDIDTYVTLSSCTIKINEPTNVDEKFITDEGNIFDATQPYKTSKKYENITVQVTVTETEECKKIREEIAEKKKNLQVIEQIKKEEEKKKNNIQDEMDSSIESMVGDIDRKIAENKKEIERLENEITKEEEDKKQQKKSEKTQIGDTENKSREVTYWPDDELPQTVSDIGGFISGFRKLITDYPYLLQTISGLDEAYKNNYVVKDSFRGSGDNKITINIYESLDLKVSSMLNKYFNAAYDAQYRRERLPINMRRFNCSVFVHDIRNFHEMLSNLGKEIRKTKEIGQIVEIALNSLSVIEFKFYGCEIVPEETGSIFENVTNAEPGDMRMTNFTFTYSDCVINFMPFESLLGHIKDLRKDDMHKPYAEKAKNIKKPASNKITWKKDDLYAKSSTFDRKARFVGGGGLPNEQNVYDSGSKTNSSYNDNGISGEAQLSGIYESHNTKPNKEGEPSPLGNVNDNDKKEGKKYGDYSYEEKASISGIKALSSDDGKIHSIGNVNENDSEEGAVITETNTSTVENIISVGHIGNVYGGTIDEQFEGNEPTQTPTPQLNGINSTHFEGKVDYIGNINVNDIDEGTPGILPEDAAKLEQASSAVMQSYADMSPLGNVNNNDYQEHLNLMRNRDILLSARDAGMTDYATFNAIGSANENYFDTKAEVDRLMAFLSSSVSASIGVPTENVYSQYFDQINNIVNPNTPVDVVEDINYISTGNNSNTSVEPGVSQLEGISSNIVNGYVDSIGNINANDELENTPQYQDAIINISGLSTQTVGNTISSLGDVIDDDVNNGYVETIGDVIPDPTQPDNVESLGNVYPPQDATQTQGYIEDVLPDDVNNTHVTGIGNVYPAMFEPDIQGYIEDVIPDMIEPAKTDSIGNVYPFQEEVGIQGYIEDVLPDDNNNETVSEIGNVIDRQAQPDNVKEIGDVIPDTTEREKISDLGNTYPPQENKHTQGYIGDVVPDTENTKNIVDIGDVIPDEKGTVRNITEIGDVYNKIHMGAEGYAETGEPIETIGKVNVSQENGKVRKNIGSTDVTDTKNEILKSLKKLSENRNRVRIVKDLGNVNTKNEKRED